MYNPAEDVSGGIALDAPVLSLATPRGTIAVAEHGYGADTAFVTEVTGEKITTGPWPSLDGISFTRSTARIEDMGDRGRGIATAKYGDILIDGVPLEFD